MSITRTKECRTCGATEPRGWTEEKEFICSVCRNKTVGEVLGYRTLTAPRSMANKSHAAAMARAMAQDKRPAARGTQQDPISDPMHILNPLNPISPVSPLNPLNDWDSSSHRQYEASSVSSVCDDSSRHTSHSSGYESSSSYDSGSYDSGSSSSGGCD